LTAEEAQAAFEAPYDNQQPRSQMSLARAATVAAVSPANRRHLRALPFRPLEYRRADGHRELPHESDADNWVPPPPAYTATAAAAGSVSLSHPVAPPVPRRPVLPPSSIPPVPALPASINHSRLAPSAPYQSRGQSISSIDLSTPPQQESERRPSLLHPSTYPSPQSSGSIRRRSSTARSPPQDMAAPQHTNRPPLSHQSTSSSSMNPLRRPSLRARHAVESTVELRPPPLHDPNAVRRGSAPNVPLAAQGRRPIFTSPLDRVNTAESATCVPASSQPSRRGLLPRLVPPEPGMAQGQRFPVSAPPRTEPMPFANPMQQQPGMYAPHAQMQPQQPFHAPGPVLEIVNPAASGRMSRMTGRDGTRTPGPGEERRRRKIGCVVM
jgi:hypothetical protein